MVMLKSGANSRSERSANRRAILDSADSRLQPISSHRATFSIFPLDSSILSCPTVDLICKSVLQPDQYTVEHRIHSQPKMLETAQISGISYQDRTW